LSGTNADESTELAALQKSIELLDVAAEAMVVADDDLSSSLLCRGDNSLDAARRQRQRSLAQDIDLRFECAQDVRLVKVIWRGDDYGIDLIELEQILNVGEDIGNLETLGDGARLRTIIVTESYELRALDFGKHWKVRELCDRPRADESEADCVFRRF